MNIGQLAARLAKLPRPEIYRSMSDAEYSEGLAIMLADLELLARKDGCIAAAFALSFFDAATSYPVVRPEDVKHGELYFMGTDIVMALNIARNPVVSDGLQLFVATKWRKLLAENPVIRGPIPRPE